MTKAEKQARLHRVLEQFSKEELTNPETKKSIESTIRYLYGTDQAKKLVKALENSGVLPRYTIKLEDIRV